MILTMLLSWMAQAACPTTSVQALVDQVEAPAIVVLGERHGHRRELKRAARVVEAFAARGPVTVALEAVRGERQEAVEAFADHGRRCRLKRDLDWKETWGYRYGAYWRTLRQGRDGVRLVGAGLALGPAPAGKAIAIPDGYEEQLAEAMEGHELPPDMKARFTRSMAWRDLRIGELAVAGWDGEGVLIILTGRGHVEGGRGTPWQLRRQVQVPVHAALLDAEDAECPAGNPALEG